jgi:hypothetical protein
MKTLCPLVVFIVAAQASFASAIGYTDANAWLAALDQAEASAGAGSATTLTEDFTGNQLHVPGLSVTSPVSVAGGTFPGTGQITGDAWTGQSLKYELTTWTYNGAGRSLYGWGAYFDMPVVQSGLEVFGDGFNLFFPYQPAVTYPLDGYPPFSGFWGFVSTAPFSYVDVSFGQDGPPCECYGQTYTMDNLQLGIAATAAVSTPEPDSAALAVTGLFAALGAGWWRTRR